MLKKGTFASPATAFARRVLPVPGGPTRSTPFGIFPPSFWNLSGVFRNSTTSRSSSLASSIPATSAKVTFVSLSAKSLALLLANDMTPWPGPILFMANRQMRTIMASGSTQVSIAAEQFAVVASGIIYLAVIKLLDEAGVIHPNRRELLVRLVFFPLQRSGDILRAYGQFTHRTLCHLLLKLAIGDGLHLGRRRSIAAGTRREGRLSGNTRC